MNNTASQPHTSLWRRQIIVPLWLQLATMSMAAYVATGRIVIAPVTSLIIAVVMFGIVIGYKLFAATYRRLMQHIEASPVDKTAVKPEPHWRSWPLPLLVIAVPGLMCEGISVTLSLIAR